MARDVIDQLIEGLNISPKFKQHLQKGWHPEFDFTVAKTPIEFSKEIAFEFFCDEYEVKPEWETYFQCEAKDNKIVISLYHLPELTFTLVLDEDGAPSHFRVKFQTSMIINNAAEPLKFDETIKGKLSIFPPDFREYLEKILRINAEVNQATQELGSLDNVAQDIPNQPGWMKINKRALLGLVFAKTLMSDFIAEKINQEMQFVSDEFGELGSTCALELTDAQVDDAIKSILSSRRYVVQTQS